MDSVAMVNVFSLSCKLHVWPFTPTNMKAKTPAPLKNFVLSSIGSQSWSTLLQRTCHHEDNGAICFDCMLHGVIMKALHMKERSRKRGEPLHDLLVMHNASRLNNFLFYIRFDIAVLRYEWCLNYFHRKLQSISNMLLINTNIKKKPWGVCVCTHIFWGLEINKTWKCRTLSNKVQSACSFFKEGFFFFLLHFLCAASSPGWSHLTFLDLLPLTLIYNIIHESRHLRFWGTIRD